MQCSSHYCKEFQWLHHKKRCPGRAGLLEPMGILRELALYNRTAAAGLKAAGRRNNDTATKAVESIRIFWLPLDHCPVDTTSSLTPPAAPLRNYDPHIPMWPSTTMSGGDSHKTQQFLQWHLFFPIVFVYRICSGFFP